MVKERSARSATLSASPTCLYSRTKSSVSEEPQKVSEELKQSFSSLSLSIYCFCVTFVCICSAAAKSAQQHLPWFKIGQLQGLGNGSAMRAGVEKGSNTPEREKLET